MTIDSMSEPPDGIKVVTEALQKLKGTFGDNEAPLGGDSPNSTITKPLPIYTVEVEKINGVDFLQYVKLVGWRYVVVADSGISLVDISKSKSASLAFSNLIEGDMAKSLTAVINAADAIHGTSTDSYVARIFENPALHVSAFWLHGTRQDRFFPIFLGQQNPAMPAEASDFLGMVAKRAKQIREDYQVPPH